MTSSLVGSEMCIRDRSSAALTPGELSGQARRGSPAGEPAAHSPHRTLPVSYTHLTLPTICSV
eukprot:8748333-Prorocentrum_lima.AAC.1